MSELKQLEALFTQKNITRREFIRKASVMGLAAAEATIVLAIVVVVAKRFGSAQTSDITTLKE